MANPIDGACPQLTITKDSTFRLSWGAMIAIVVYVGGASYWFSEVRQADRDAVKNLDKELTRQIETLRIDATRRVDGLTSDFAYFSKRSDGYFNRFDRFDEAIRELKLVQHRIERTEHSGADQDRRMGAHEGKLEEIYRRLAEHSVVIEYLRQWLNQDSASPFKKRNKLLLPKEVPNVENASNR